MKAHTITISTLIAGTTYLLKANGYDELTDKTQSLDTVGDEEFIAKTSITLMSEATVLACGDSHNETESLIHHILCGYEESLKEPSKSDTYADLDEYCDINQPVHYQLPDTDVQWIDVRDSLLKAIPPDVPYAIVTYWSEALTYLARMWSKNGVEDAKKAQYYLNRMLNNQ